MTDSGTATIGRSPDSLSLRQQVDRAERRHFMRMMALMMPSVFVIALFFLLPVALFMFRSIDNSDLRARMPQTIAGMGSWDGRDLPGEAVYAAIHADLRHMTTADAANLGRILNYIQPGFRSLIITTVRGLPQVVPPQQVKQTMVEIDSRWSQREYMVPLFQQSGRFTSFHLLAALDLRLDPDGSIGLIDGESAIFKDLFVRTAKISLMVTAICLLVGYPVAHVMATSRPVNASRLLMLVLVPFWTSLLVRTTAWVILLQTEGIVNSALMGAGLIRDPLRLIYNQTGIYIAMVHILLPYMILPLYSVMKNIQVNHLRAAASLGASPFTVFRTIYLPLTMPGILAGCILVFVLSVGFYVTPALVGGPGDQMVGYFIAYFTTSSVNWGLSSALGSYLLLLVALIYLVIGRAIGLDKMRVR